MEETLNESRFGSMHNKCMGCAEVTGRLSTKPTRHQRKSTRRQPTRHQVISL